MNRTYAVETSAALGALGAALLLNHRLGRLASDLGESGPQAADSLLAALPILDTRLLFTWGFGLFVLLAIVVALTRERDRLGWIAWSYALLITVRGVCVLLTPLHAPAGALWVAGDPLYERLGRYLTFPNDLFFSSHTALPFLGALLFRDRAARAACLALSVTLAATVLLARLHYSIDVAAAYAFAYGTQQANRRWLRPLYRRFKQGGWPL